MNILIIKLSALGDAVMAGTMVPALRKQHPGARITWLCSNEIADFVKLYNGVDEILTVDNRLLTRGISGRIRFVLSVWKHIAGRRYDMCILAHSDKRYGLLPLLTRCGDKRVFGIGRSGPVPGRYHGTEYARLALGTDSNLPSPFPLCPVDITPSDKAKNMVLLLPGGAKNIMNDNSLRRWPVEHYRELAETLLKKGIPVGLIGGSDDTWVEKTFEGLNIVSFIGKTDIKALLELLKGAEALVSHDSGPLHLAMLAGIKVVALFGPVNPSERIPPQQKNIEALTYPIPCAPCYDGHGFAKCPSNLCLKNVTADDVLQALTRLNILPEKK